MVSMFALRYVCLLALVVWLGGLIVLASVSAPATFEVLQSRDPAAGRVLAGAVFGESLRRFSLISYAAGAVLLTTLLAMAVLGPRPYGFAIRIAIVCAMLAMTACSDLVIARRIATLQREVNGPMAALPDGDPRRAEFGRLHGLSSVLLLVTVAGGLVLLGWHARE